MQDKPSTLEIAFAGIALLIMAALPHLGGNQEVTKDLLSRVFYLAITVVLASHGKDSLITMLKLFVALTPDKADDELLSSALGEEAGKKK